MSNPERKKRVFQGGRRLMNGRSRLGCQVKMSKDLDGLVVRMPSMTRNLQSRDFER